MEVYLPFFPYCVGETQVKTSYTYMEDLKMLEINGEGGGGWDTSQIPHWREIVKQIKGELT